jgi:hypothetical protein
MLNLELQTLGLTDLSNEDVALTQIVGGRRGGRATIVPYNNVNSGNAVAGFVQETTTSTSTNRSPVTVFSLNGDGSNINDRFVLGTMTLQSNGKYFGQGSRPRSRLRAQRLNFDGFDIVEFEGLRGSIS